MTETWLPSSGASAVPSWGSRRSRASGILLVTVLAAASMVVSPSRAEAVAAGCIEAKSAAAGAQHNLIIDASSSVWAWGANDEGQLGDGTKVSRSVPTLLTTIGDVAAVAAGSSHSLALKRDGTVWAWGNNSNGQLGNGTTADSATPVQVLGLSGIKAIAAGADHSMARGSDDLIRIWGSNEDGQLGDGSNADSSVPIVPSSLGAIKDFAAGDRHSLALNLDSTVSAWGSNSAGQLGNGSSQGSPTPTRVAGLRDITSLAAGSQHSLARREGGSVFAWGSNSHGQLGRPGPGSDVPQPATFVGPMDDSVNWLYRIDLNILDPIVRVSAGGNHSAGLSGKGRAWTWGQNGSGELGHGGTDDSWLPTKLPSFWRAVGSGSAHTVLVGMDDSLASVGDNSRGQLADGTLMSREALAPIGCPLSGSPSQPLNVAASAGDSSVTLTWDPPQSQGSSPITSYTVDSSDRKRVVLVAPEGGTPPRQATITGLTNGQIYTFNVRATNSRGFGARSNSSGPVVPRFVVPTPPLTVVASVSDRTAVVSWSKPSNEGASPVTSYTVTSSTGLSRTLTGSPPSTSTTFTDLAYGTPYTFTVVATNSHGTSPASVPSNTVIPARIPDTPSQVVAEARDGAAVVRWQPGFNGGRAVTNVKVTANPGGMTKEVSCGVSSVTFTGLTNGTAYGFSVVATNAIGSSPAGQTATSVTPAPNVGLMGYYADGAKVRYGDLNSPSAGDAEIALRGVATEWLDFDLRSEPTTSQQPGLTSYLGRWDGWPNVNSDCTPLTDMGIQTLSDWGANIVRVAVSPTFWGSDPAKGEPGCQPPLPGYRENVDEVVRSITARRMIALLDLHTVKRIPCTSDWNRLHPMADSSAIAFWESVTRTYLREPLVAMELFNEPHTNYLNHGSQPWVTWLHGGSVRSCPGPATITDPCPGGDGAQWVAAGMQQMYNAIRAVENGSIPPVRHLVFVGGNNLATLPPPPEYMIRDADGSPADNVIYAVHHYSALTTTSGGKTYVIPDCAPSPSFPTGCLKQWADFSRANAVPVNVTEFGWPYGPASDPYSPTYPKPAGQEQHENVICSATNAGFGWMAYRWTSDHDHSPALDQHYGLLTGTDQTLPNFIPNTSGQVVKTALGINPMTAAGRTQLADQLAC